jgi:hypothetical protein
MIRREPVKNPTRAPSGEARHEGNPGLTASQTHPTSLGEEPLRSRAASGMPPPARPENQGTREKLCSHPEVLRSTLSLPKIFVKI